MGIFGLIKGTVIFILKSIIAVFILGIVIGLLPGLPPENLQFSRLDIPNNRELIGALSLNKQLKYPEKLFENEIHGPESLVYHKGLLYTTLHGGQVVTIANNKIKPFVKFGKPCAGLFEEHICGRPLGLTIHRDNLYVADAYYGLFKVNISTRAVEQLVNPDTVIEGRKPKIFNSVAVSSDGTVYWTDSDSNLKLYDGAFSYLADGTGRLIKYDPKTKTNTVLVDRIRFANGVAISPDESFIAIAETFNYRLLRYYLKGPKKGTWDVFVDRLPGAPDNLKLDSKGNFYVPLIQPRDLNSTPSIMYSLHKYPLVRKSVSRILVLLQRLFEYGKPILPENISEKVVHAIGHFETVTKIFPKLLRFTLVIVDKEGNIVTSYHVLDGSVAHICDVEPVGDYLYLGSPFNRYLGRVQIPVEMK